MALLTILDSCVDLSGLPRWLSGKESACQYRRLKRHRFNPWVRKIPWRRKWQSTPAFLPGKSRGQWSLAVYSPWSHKRVKHSLAAKQQQQQIYTFSGQHITKEIHDQPPTPLQIPSTSSLPYPQKRVSGAPDGNMRVSSYSLLSSILNIQSVNTSYILISFLTHPFFIPLGLLDLAMSTGFTPGHWYWQTFLVA